MTETIADLFDLLKEKDTDLMDWTHLKAYMSYSNVQNHNPTLFKKINDMALTTDFEGTLDKDQFIALFLNQGLLRRDISQPANSSANEPPDIAQIAELFEFLDEDRTGMIEAKDLMNALEIAERLKLAAFEHEKFEQNRQITPPALENKLNLMRREVNQLIQSFDLTGDGMLGPEEFFNIIMYVYDN